MKDRSGQTGSPPRLIAFPLVVEKGYVQCVHMS